jgi:hypothetical protein
MQLCLRLGMYCFPKNGSEVEKSWVRFVITWGRMRLRSCSAKLRSIFQYFVLTPNTIQFYACIMKWIKWYHVQ